MHMSNSITKATVALVKLRYDVEVEGLLLPDGSYAIAVPQIADLLITGNVEKDGIKTSKNQLSKNLKRLCGESFKTSKAKTEFNKNVTTIVTLPQFEKILAKLDRAGNKQAQQLRDDLAGLGLRQMFADAFGEKFEVEERQEWLKQRAAHRQQFHPCLTKWLQKDGATGKDYGKQVNLFKSKAKCPLKSVSEYDSVELHQLNNAEVRYDVLRRTGMDHVEAVSYLS